MTSSVSPLSGSNYSVSVPTTVQSLASAYQEVSDPLGVTPSVITTLSTEGLKYLGSAVGTLADEASALGSSVVSAAKSGLQAVESGAASVEASVESGVGKAFDALGSAVDGVTTYAVQGAGLVAQIVREVA